MLRKGEKIKSYKIITENHKWKKTNGRQKQGPKKKKKYKGNKLKKLTNMVDVIPTVLIKTLKHQKKKKCFKNVVIVYELLSVIK